MDANRHDQMRAAVQRFHEAHPEVWHLFCRFTLERIRLGFKQYSADAIFHRIRWETAKPTYTRGEEFKLNNNHVAFYSRRFAKTHPQHADFFNTRKQTSAAAPPAPAHELGPGDFQ